MISQLRKNPKRFDPKGLKIEKKYPDMDDFTELMTEMELTNIYVIEKGEFLIK